jgi:hypothetical protein
VGKYSASEKTMLLEANSLASKRQASLKAQASADMKRIQQKLQEDLEGVENDRDAAVSLIRDKFRPLYEDSGKRLATDKEAVVNRVGKFGEDVLRLPYDKLESLIKMGRASFKTADGTMLEIVCPDQEG